MRLKNLILLQLIIFPLYLSGESVNIDYNLLLDLERQILKSSESIRENNLIPDAVIKDLNDETKETYLAFSKESQEWIHNELPGILLNQEIRDIYSEFDWLSNNDGFLINTEIFIEYLRGKHIDIAEKFRSLKVFRLESRKPTQVLTPIGKNKILWIWDIEIDEREHGILHVGFDVKTRNFICYEHTIGIYYPENDRLNLIHKKIVQNNSRYDLIDWHLNNLTDNNVQE